MINDRNWSLTLLLLRLFLIRFCFSSLFFFWYCMLCNHDPWQISVSKPGTFLKSTWWFRFVWNSISLQFSSSEVVGQISCSRDDKNLSTTGTNLQDFEKLLQKVGTQYCWTWFMSKVCENVSSRPTGLFCRFRRNESAFSPFPATTTQLFSQSLSSHTLWSCL